MKPFTEEQERRSLAQGRANAGREESEDFKPVVKLFCPMERSHVAPVRTRLSFGVQVERRLTVGNYPILRVRCVELGLVGVDQSVNHGPSANNS
jgi:hypothetical protein